MPVFTERNYAKKLDERVKNIPHVTVFDLMATIYDFMSECYTTGELLEKTRAVKVLTDSISNELLEELEGLEP